MHHILGKESVTLHCLYFIGPNLAGSTVQVECMPRATGVENKYTGMLIQIDF